MQTPTLLSRSTAPSQPNFWQRISIFNDRAFQYWAIVPMMVILIGLTLQPALQLVAMSFSNVEFAQGRLQWEFIGIQPHIQTMLTDPVVPDAFRNTIIFVIAAVVIETLLGLALALAVSRVLKAVSFYRAVYVVPLLIPPVAIGTMWRLMYDYNYGVINQALAFIGIQGPTWTADPNLALVSIIITDIWHWTSFVFLILLAGVESLPLELNEAARVDGASEWQVMWHIVLPLLRPTILVAMMLRTIFAFKVFDQVFVLTGGGPGTASQVISMYIYEVFFIQFRLGYGALLALITGLLVSVFVVIYQWLNALARSQM